MKPDVIREAALDVFLDKGYSQATLADVAQWAGASEAQVTELFADKEGLLAAALGPGYDALEELLGSADLTPDSFIDGYIGLSLVNRKAFTLTTTEPGVANDHPTLGPRVRPLATRMLAALGATGDEASQVHAWAALAVIESTIAFLPGISPGRMRIPLRKAALGALHGSSA